MARPVHFWQGRYTFGDQKCIKAVTTKRLNSTAGNIKNSAFIYAGFCNWKDATVAFPNHEKSDTHETAVELVVTLPETTKDVGELLSFAYLKCVPC